MATIALQIAGTAFGSTLGGPLGGALGSAIGGSFGAMIDRSWMGSGPKLTQGPRLNTMTGISATEGAAIPRLYGRARLGGQIIWATEFEEEQVIQKTGKSGGKSTGGAATGKSLTYTYYANVAIGLCEGPINLLRRIWADGKELDLSAVTFRFYEGSAQQIPDPLLVAKQETGEIPAFRGLAYVVLERFPLADYGNRLPQFSFEVVRAAPGLPDKLRAINIIPGATEFGYASAEVREDFGYGTSQALNRAQWTHSSDWDASISDLLALAPNLERATLISSWFGDDLRAGQCTLRPKVEKNAKVTLGAQWAASGLNRASARAVSSTDSRPSYGGSPSDASVIAALRDLKARGLKVALHPFVLMDIPGGNTLPDPYSGSASQPAFPWRGRITCDPAPGRAGSPEGSVGAASQIAAFVGTASATHFSLSGESVVYTGPAEWSFRRMVLHHAMLAKAAGGVDSFILASELVGLTHVMGAGGSFPFVAAMTGLLSELRAILGAACTITYAADWTEYGARVRNGGQDLRFPLDPLWAHPQIGAISIDFYPPLSDWRAGNDHLDAAIARHGAQSAYLASRIASGEAFDFYYAGSSERAAQQRSPITDGAYAKPWVYRAKDLVGFWSQPHVERINGMESATPTAFVPRAKPIVLAEIGCPAVSRGANEPNVFPDPKSVENALPHFSSGARDDLVQRRVLEAYLERFDPTSPGFDAAHNPLSPVYGGRMVAPDFIAPWAWDARPYPAFPRLQSLWADGGNWLRGHWLNGRLEGLPLRELMSMIAEDYALDTPMVEDIEGFANGYVIERPMSARAALEPIINAFSLLAMAKAGTVAIRAPERTPVSLAPEELIPDADGTLIAVTRAQESELPARLTLGFVDDEDDFQPRIVAASAQALASRREEALETALALPRAQARRLVEARLTSMLSQREHFAFRLPNARLGLEVGDAVQLPTQGGPRKAVLTRITDAAYRSCEAVALEAPQEDILPQIDAVPPETNLPALPGAAHARLIELPLAQERAGLLMAAVRADPWRGPYSVVQTEQGGAVSVGSVVAAARFGQTMAALAPGPLWRWDEAGVLDVTLSEGALSSLNVEAVLAGASALAITGADGVSEIILFRTAILTGARRYTLRGLLRGIGGSEAAAARLLPAGSEVLVLDDALLDLGVNAQALGSSRSYTVLPAGRDLGDATGVALGTTLQGTALRPLSPVHARARRESGGVRITFIRRTRLGGDNWDAFEVPLNEEREEYRLDILAGSVIKRSVTLNSSEFLYPLSAEIADFGSAQAQLSLSISQVSAVYGPGAALKTQIRVN